MLAVRADDSGEHERVYCRSGRGCKSFKASSTAPAALAMMAAMRRAL